MATRTYSPYSYSYNYTKSYNTYMPGTSRRTSSPSPSSYKSTSYGTSYRSNNATSSLRSTPGGTTAPTLYSTKYGSRATPSYRSTTPTRHRPLPSGPGPLDSHGRKMDLTSSSSSWTSGTSTLKRTPTPTRTPIKADHSYSPTNYTSPTRDRLSRKDRKSSVSDLTNGVDNLRLHERDINANSRNSNYDSRPSKEILDNPGLTKKPPIGGTSTSTFKRTAPLPSISKTNGTSRSPSLERYSKHDSSSYESKSRHDSKQSLDSNDNVKSNGYSADRGLVGLRNLGNTCFMNSVLQGIFNTRYLLEYFVDDNNYTSEINTNSSMKGALIKSFAKLMKDVWKVGAPSYLSPTEFKSQISKFAPRFIGYNQQDSQEFLIYLLEGLHEDLNRVTVKKKRTLYDDSNDHRISAAQKAAETWKHYLSYDNSKIVDIFVGQLKSSLKCTVCGYVSNTFDPFWGLSLPIKKGRYGATVTLYDCFDLFTAEETLEGDERPTCEKCKKRQTCTKRFSVQKFPKVLVIHLKRFNQESAYRSKLSTHVDYPLNGLDLTNYFSDSGTSGNPQYNLYAVSNHSGTPFGGHYTANGKHPYSAEWHHFNDQRVSKVSERSICSSEGYVLFYELSNKGGSRL